MRARLTFRMMLTAVTIIVTGLALFVSGALVVLTSRLHESSVSLAASIESVRLAEEAEVSLLLYGRERDPLIRQNIAGDLRHNLSEGRRYATSEREHRELDQATAYVEKLLGTPPADLAEAAARELAAYNALETLIDVNAEESKRLQARAAQWDRLADAIGIPVSFLLVVVAIAFVWWLRTRAFQPVFDLAEAMERFGRGERSARAPEQGPRELRDMVVRFNQMAAALSAQHGAQTAFLGGVAHDLRNPLMVLMLQLELLSPDRPLPPEPVIRKTLEIINRQTARLERMMGDLLDMTKLDSGELELHLGEHDLREVLQEMVEPFEASSPRHRIHVSVPEEPVVVRSDPLRIEQVVTNLLSNAIKYSPGGGPVDLELRPNGTEVLLAVTDRGVGIAPDDQRRLFEPFRRVGLSTESIPGVGLGLFVVRRIVEAHGGRIEVESEPGKGSTFRVHLPLGRS